MNNTQPKWKRILPSVLWSLAGVILCVLLVSAVQRNNQLHCSHADIIIAGFKNEMFISEADVQAIIEGELNRKIKGCSMEKMDLRKLENRLQKDSWISKAQLFIDNKQVLHVNVSERLPVARIFTQANRSFYIDSEAVVLPLSNYAVADVPVFTNVPEIGKEITPADSIFRRQLSSMGSYIISDSFLLMQIGQVSIRPDMELELYPVIGNHIIRFGSPDNYQPKLVKLTKFYKQVMAKAGLNKYSILDLRYDKQIVAKLRSGKEVLPLEPQMRIQTDMLATTATEEKIPTAIAVVAKQPAPEKKKTNDRVAATVKKEKPTEKVVKKEKKKLVKEVDKIIIASNNKPDKKAIKQLPKKIDKTAMVEVDLKRKSVNETGDHPKAVMPKKQNK